jgi:hypothetical protein
MVMTTVRTPATNAASRACSDRSRQGPKPANGFEEAEAVDSTARPYPWRGQLIR